MGRNGMKSTHSLHRQKPISHELRSEQVSGASERANGGANGPVLYGSISYHLNPLCNGHPFKRPLSSISDVEMLCVWERRSFMARLGICADGHLSWVDASIIWWDHGDNIHSLNHEFFDYNPTATVQLPSKDLFTYSIIRQLDHSIVLSIILSFTLCSNSGSVNALVAIWAFLEYIAASLRTHFAAQLVRGFSQWAS